MVFLLALDVTLLMLMFIGAAMISLVAAIPFSRPGGLTRIFAIAVATGAQLLVMGFGAIMAIFWGFPSAFVDAETIVAHYGRFSVVHIISTGTMGSMIAFIGMTMLGLVAMMVYACASEVTKDFRIAIRKIRTGQILPTPRAISREVVSEYFMLSMFFLTLISIIGGAFLIKNGLLNGIPGVGLIAAGVGVFMLMITMSTLSSKRNAPMSPVRIRRNGASAQ